MEAANTGSIIVKEKQKRMKKNNNGWEQILFYDIRRLEAIEEEMKSYLSDLLSKTHSLRLTTIIQKYLIFSDESIGKLNILIKEGGIGVLLQTSSMVSAFWRDTKEKLNYCNQGHEIDHCIISSLLSIAKLKTYQYEQAAQLSDKLGHPSIKNLLQGLYENEQRVTAWLAELLEKEKIEQEETPLNHSLMRQAYWLL